MIMAGAESMLDVLLNHLEKANRRFIFEGAKVFSRNEQGDELYLLRSPELIATLQNGSSHVVFCGDDILRERELQLRARNETPPPVHVMAIYEKYGRNLVTPRLDLVVVGDEKEGLEWIRPGNIILTEHPYLLKQSLEQSGHITVIIGQEGEDAPMFHDQFKVWGQEEGLVGIEVVKGKTPALLGMGYGDAATLVNETGKTVKDNELTVAYTILAEIHTLLIASDGGLRDKKDELETLIRDLDEGYVQLLKEFETNIAGAERV